MGLERMAVVSFSNAVKVLNYLGKIWKVKKHPIGEVVIPIGPPYDEQICKPWSVDTRRPDYPFTLGIHASVNYDNFKCINSYLICPPFFTFAPLFPLFPPFP